MDFAPRHLALGLVLCALLLAAWEGVLAAHDAPREGIVHDPDRWRARFEAAPPRPAVVFLGTSRTRCGISPAAVAKGLGADPGQVLNLGIDNTSPLPVLEALLARGAFPERVVIEVMPGNLFAEQRGTPPALHSPAPWTAPEVALRSTWRRRTRLSNPDLRPQGVAPRVLRYALGRAGHPLRDASYALHPDGWLEFRGLAPGEEEVRVSPQVFFREYRPLDEEALAALLARLRGQVAALEAGGTRVWFLRLPSSGFWGQAEATTFPRSAYWNRLATTFPGRCLWVGEPPLERLSLELPDGSHLESRSARAFSRRLGEVLR